MLNYDFIFQVIFMAAAFYTAILTMLKIKRRYRWFLVPSFIIYTISDMWLAYLYSSEADPQFIHIIKGLSGNR